MYVCMDIYCIIIIYSWFEEENVLEIKAKMLDFPEELIKTNF